jgi:trk system potassium uptake protein TrkA
VNLEVNIVIAGGGKIGETLCQELSMEDIDIVLLEKNQNRLERIINKTDITGLTGDAADYDNLVEAGVQNCDLFIAVTPEDETNIISSVIAKKLGTTHTIARVRNPKYANHMEFVRDSLGISMVINPEMEAAKDISQNLEFPEALSVEPFENGRVNIIEVIIKKNSRLVNTSLNQFRQEYGDVLICAVTHLQSTFIPSGETILREGDRLYVTGAKDDLNSFYKKAGYKDDKIRSSLIIGGGRITYYLLQLLAKAEMDIKVIELNYETAVDLSTQFPDVVIIRGDGTDQEFLNEERIDKFDSVVSLTGIDEENIINSLYSVSLGINKVITKVSRTGLLEILGDTGLQSIVTPKLLITDKILRFVRSLKSTKASNVEALYRIADNKVEALQFLVKKDSRVIGITLNELNTKNNLLVAYIIRENKLIFPSGDDSICEGDHVIIVTTYKAFDDIDDILR